MKKLSVKFMKKKIALIPVLIFLNLFAFGLAFCVFLNFYNKGYDIRFIDGSISIKSKSELQEEVQKASDDSMMNIQCNVNPNFQKAGTQGDLFVANSYENKADIKMSIVLKDSDDVVKETQVLKPGTSLHSLGLDKALAAGDYPAIAKISFLNADGEVDAENQVDMILHVEN